MKTVTEGSAKIQIPGETKISKKLAVFYNPVMKLNRDLSVLLLNSVENMQMQIADIMAGTGVRTIRFIKELKKGKIKKITANDRFSADKIKKNLKLNKANAEVHAEDANEFLLQSKGFDCIDIDPFGSPNDFLDASIKRIARNGILAVTATDTAALCGTYPRAGERNYWAKTFRNGFMHESSLRILARKVQLIGAQYDKAMIPIFSYAKEHYVRIFFKCIKSKEECDKIIQQHKYVLYNPKTMDYEASECSCKKDYVATGPMFIGCLNDKALASKMLNEAKAEGVQNENKEAIKLLKLVHDELDVVGSYDLHELSALLKIKVPNFEYVMKQANATRTHYNPNTIKTKLTAEQLKLIVK